VSILGTNIDTQPITVKKVLMRIDKSEYREKILAYAIALTKAWGAELTAIHVIDPGRGLPGGRIKEKEQERRGGKTLGANTSTECDRSFYR
jgi:hypothetical protein